MAIIKSKKAWWERVEGAHEYHVRVTDVGVVTDFKQLENIAFAVVPQSDSPEIEVDMASLGLGIEEGTYDVFIAPADQWGNEPDPLGFRGTVFDFTPPPPITRGGFR